MKISARFRAAVVREVLHFTTFVSAVLFALLVAWVLDADPTRMIAILALALACQRPA